MLLTDADPYLSSSDLRRLTGRCHHAKQIAWLKKYGWPHEVSSDERILVLREYYLARFNGRTENKPTVFSTRNHNFAAIG